jgi:DNA-binding transcriptional LysR family regulator
VLRLGLSEASFGPAFDRFVRECQFQEEPLLILPLERPASTLIDYLIRGVVDAILTREVVTIPDVHCHFVWSDRIAAMASHGGKGPLSSNLHELAKGRLILPDPECARGLARQINALFAEHRIAPSDTIIAGGMQTALHLAAAGIGVGLFPEGVVYSPSTLKARIIEPPNACLQTWICIRNGDPSPAAHCAVRLAKAAANRQAGE